MTLCEVDRRDRDVQLRRGCMGAVRERAPHESGWTGALHSVTACMQYAVAARCNAEVDIGIVAVTNRTLSILS